MIKECIMKISRSVAYKIYNLKNGKKGIFFNRNSQNYMFLEGLSAELFDLLLSNDITALNMWLDNNDITADDVEEFKEEIKQFENDVKKSVDKANSSNVVKEAYNPILSDFIEELHRNGLYYSFHIDLTNRCNEKCIHCYHPFDTYQISKELNTSEVKSLIDIIDDLGVFDVTLSGGEALLREDIEEILEYISEKGMMISLYSNGLLLSEEVVSKLCEYRIKTVSISLYGDIAEVHDQITTVQGSFERTLKGIEILKKYKIPFDLKCVMLSQNINRANEILAFFNSLNDGKECKIDFSLCGKLNGDCENFQYMPSEQEIEKVFYGNPERYIGNRDLLQRSPDQAPCSAGKYGLYCSAEGDIYPCVSFRLHLCNYKDLPYISENLILKQWQKTRIRDFTECFTYSYCNYCTEQCAGNNLIENGNYLNSRVRQCVHAKIIEKWFLHEEKGGE